MGIYTCFLVSWLLVSTIFDFDPIITRHDLEDQDFVNLAKKFENVICHLNLPDCEGTIIANQWVISAAHCSVFIENKLKAGEQHFVIINGREMEVDKVIIHKKWKKDEAFDLALIHLKNQRGRSDKAFLYQTDDELDQIVYLVGTGDKGNGLIGINGNDGNLRAATNKVEEATDYWLKWNFNSPDEPAEYVTEYEGISGPGDSGGPAFIVDGDLIYLAGISSGQSTKKTGGVEGLYGVKEYYVRISRYIKWINREMHKAGG